MKEIKVKAEIANINLITEIIDSELEKLDCSLKAQMLIDVAIDELCSNVCFYAYGEEKGDMTVRFEVNSEKNQVTLSFLDEGKQYNPLEKEDPDVKKLADSDKVGGLGIYMVKNSMDDMKYAYENGRNIVTIVKKIV